MALEHKNTKIKKEIPKKNIQNIGEQTLEELKYNFLIELTTIIGGLKNSLIVDKNTGSIDLSDLIYKKLEPLLKDKINLYIEHPKFYKIILNTLNLKGKYELYFNEPKKKVKLINIDNDRRFNGIGIDDINKLIGSTLNIYTIEDLKLFLDRFISKLDLNFKEYIGLDNYDTYIYNILKKHLEKTIPLDKNMSSVLLEAIAGKLYRDNLIYINEGIGHKILGEISDIILDQILKGNKSYRINEVNNSLKNIIDDINNYNGDNLEELYLEFLKYVSNMDDIVGLCFEKMYNLDIDANLKKGIITFLISNNKLGTNYMNVFLDLILNKINNKKEIGCLDNLIVKDKIIFKELKISLLERKGIEYNYKQTIDYIRGILNNIKHIKDTLKDKKNELQQEESIQYTYQGTIANISKQIDLLEKDYNLNGQRIKDIENKIILSKNKEERKDMQEKRDLQLQKTIDILKELENTKINYVEIQRNLYGKKIFMLKDEIEDLKLDLYNSNNEYKLIRKDILYLLMS